MKLDFAHRQAAHCESGVAANLFRFHGVDISEPMAFGIGAGLFFGYVPFLTVNGGPGLSFRTLPGQIFSEAARRLGIRTASRRFRSPGKAMDALDELLARGIAAGCVVGVYHLPYFPPAYRFHFNAHNLIVFGKEEGRYLVSDPIMEGATSLAPEELSRVRFARGFLAPRGHLYHVTGVRGPLDLPRAVRSGISKVCDRMLGIPIPLFGVRGIRFLARRLRRWPDRLGERKAALHLGQVVRMQEEIGTGGGGFRFMYAAFLQEAAALLGAEALDDASREMTAIGDRWRDFAVQASRIYKERHCDTISYDSIAALLLDLADREEGLFRNLRRIL